MDIIPDNLRIILVSYNSAEVIIACLSDILDRYSDQILIIDNASRSEDQLILKSNQIKFKALANNIGYGRASNVGFNLTNSDYVLLVNPDIKITPEQVEDLLLHAKQHPEAAIFGPATSPKHQNTSLKVQEQDAISGSCMLFDMSKIRQVGGFDENIFLFSEEVDLCWRVRSAGYKVLLFPQIYVEHLAGQSSGASDAVEYMKNWHFGWSRSYFFEKHGLNHGKKALWRRELIYRWKKLKARSNYDKVKFRGIVDGIIAYRKGEKAFETDGNTPKVAPNSATNPYCKS